MNDKLAKILQGGTRSCSTRYYGQLWLQPSEILGIYEAITEAPEGTTRSQMARRIVRVVPDGRSLSDERINRAVQLLRKAGLIAHHPGSNTSLTGGWRPTRSTP